MMPEMALVCWWVKKTNLESRQIPRDVMTSSRRADGSVHYRNYRSKQVATKLNSLSTVKLIGLPKSADSSDGRREKHLKCT